MKFFMFVFFRDGCLCMYVNKTDSKPVAFVNLSSEECTGCRRATDSDKEHTIEIVLTHGHNWYIAAATGIEANDWRQSLCQAVSEVMMVSIFHLHFINLYLCDNSLDYSKNKAKYCLKSWQ